MAFECVSRTDVGLRRQVNEDSVLVRTDRGLWAVADGMGGHEAGDVASGKVTESLRNLPIVYGLDDLVEQAVAALKIVNRELGAMAGAGAGERTPGSTVVALAIAGDQFRCFWAGDSRAYRIRDGEIIRLSRDHSLVQSLVDAGVLDPRDAEHHPNANVVTRAVGVAEDLVVDVVGGDVKPGDQYVLASDGLTRLVEDEELLHEVTSNNAEAAADRLIEMVLARGAPDNVSIVLTKVI